MKRSTLSAFAFCMLTLLTLCSSCNNPPVQQQPLKNTAAVYPRGTYAYDVSFLQQHTTDALQLTSPDGLGKVLLSAAYQARVMTSTASGDSGTSFGWLNYDLIAAPKKKKQFNPVGGEERFWMGPEGGQYSIYFKKNDSFTIAHWQVPAFIDSIAWKTTSATTNSASFTATAVFNNYTGTAFSINIDRKISLLSKDSLEQKLHVTIPAGIHFVGFETVNTVTNTGSADWVKENGLLSIWLLGMFTPGPSTKVIIPFHPVPNAKKYITTDYFGPVPEARLQVTDSIVYFTCDGRYRSKIGLSPLLAKPIAGAFDFQKNVLTILIPQVQKDKAYVNSKWELQRDPYHGDVINSYNDGPLADGTQMGPFLEIESSSAAMALTKSSQAVYRQTTCHFQGAYPALQKIARQLLGVDLDKIK